MNLFWKNFLGGITSTDKFEQEMAKLGDDMRHYAKTEQSVELAEYNELAHVVNTSEFQQKKKTLKNRKYRDTEEYRDRRKFEALNKKADIRKYYEILHSPELKEFLAFMKTPEAQQLNSAPTENDPDKLKRLRQYSSSKAYKEYTRLNDSYIIKEYEKLKERVSSEEFKQADQFWSDKNRWQSTPEYKQEERFKELAKNPDIAFFLREKPERFNALRSLSRSFIDEFDWNVLSKSNWNFGFHYGNKELVSDHSYTNEQQANNSGKNISVVNGKLHVATRKEQVRTRAWDPAKGFVEKDFDYTSDIMQSAEKFRQQYGIFQAKLRCTGKINHAFWLGCDNKQPLIKIFHFDGKTLRMGRTDENGTDETNVTGLNFSKFHVYTLIWTENELVWMINNLVVNRISTHIPKEEMYLAFNSFITQSQTPQEGLLEVDWVRVYEDRPNPSETLATDKDENN